MVCKICASIAVTAAVSLCGLASAAWAGTLVSASQQRDNKADHDKWNKTMPASKKASSSSDDDDGQGSEAKAAQAKLSPKHKGELNGHLHLSDW